MTTENNHHHHHHEVSEKSVKYLFVSFIINMLLSIAEIIGGIIAGSISLIGDALHNTCDAFSILIAVIAFKIGRKKASAQYTYGFKRAEVIGGFVNLILLFISGVYLLAEGICRLINPEPISGKIMVIISVLALVIDAITAKISHRESAHNTNMQMVFLHNLTDALGSVGVIISGLCVMYFNVYFVDGLVALAISGYMIFQATIAFLPTVNILMNGAPQGLNIDAIKARLLKIQGVRDVHHLHIWQINEHDVSLECHVKAANLELLEQIQKILEEDFEIKHSTIQIENICSHDRCDL